MSALAAGTGGPEPAGRVGASGELALNLMVAAQFMVILDASVVNVALPTIQRSLHFSPTGVEGVITAYATAFGGALILGGRIADLFGRRLAFLIGLAGFGLTSAACAAAPSGIALVVARALQGLSAAVLAPAALALLTTSFPEGPRRNAALGRFGAATSLGFVAGQALGGVLTAAIGWRSIFAINVPVAVAAIALSLRATAPDPGRGTRRLPDVAGAVLVTTGIALLVWAPTQGARHGWTSGAFLAPLAASIGVLGGWAGVEAVTRDPLVPLAFLRSRWRVAANSVTAVTGALNATTFLAISIELQRVLGRSALETGFAVVPAGLIGLVSGPASGRIVGRIGLRATLAASLGISAVLVALLSRFPAGGSLLVLVPLIVLIGATFVTSAVATTVATATGVPPERQGLAGALRQTSFQIGVALSIAILLSVAADHTSSAIRSGVPAHAATQQGLSLALLILAAGAALAAITAAVGLRQPDTRSGGTVPSRAPR